MADVIDAIIAEALGEGPAGMAAVAHVINTRALQTGKTPQQIISEAGQFSGVSNPGSSVAQSMKDPAVRAQVEQIWNGVTSGQIPNPYPNGDFFHTPGVSPDWASSYTRLGQTGNHIFYSSGKPVPAQSPRTAPTPADPITRPAQMAGLTPFTNSQGESYLNQYDFTPHAYTRTQPVQGGVQEAIANAVYSVDPELRIRVTSGGQTSSRDPALYKAANGWVGSTRHDGGGAADFALVRNGEVLPISANKAIYQSVARNLAAQGVPGIGVDVGSNFIHAGGGDVAAWGYQGSSNGAKYLDPDFAASIQEGRSMAQTGGIPRPPGMVTSPPGSAVASQLATSAPVQPKSQSNALSRERSMIPPGLPPALGAGMARLASSGARDANLPMPATPSTAMRAARQPNLMADTFGRVMPRVPPQPMAADMRATLANPATPFLTRDGQGITDPAAAVFGDMATNIGLPGAPSAPRPNIPQRFAGQERAPVPQQTETQRLAALYAGGGPTRPPGLPAPYPEIMTNDMALMRNPSQNPFLAQPGRVAPVPMPRPNFMPQVGTQLAVTPPRVAPVPFMRPNFGMGGPDIVPRRAPMPMPLAMRPPPPQTRTPLRITVNGGNVQQPAPSALRLSPAQAYEMANQAAAQRARERSGNTTERSDYFKMATGG